MNDLATQEVQTALATDGPTTAITPATSATPAERPQERALPRSQLSGPEKALVFLVSMDERVATRVIGKLTDQQVRQLRKVSMTMREVSNEDVMGVHTEFIERAGGGSAASLEGSGSYLRRLAGKALGEGRAAELWSDRDPKRGSMANLAALDTATIAGFMENEQPQTIALLLSQIDSSKTGEVVKHMPTERQADIILRMARLDSVPASVMEDIEKEFEQEIAALGSTDRQSLQGFDAATGLLKRLGNEQSEELIDMVSLTDPVLADKLRNSMFTFEDLVRVDSRGMQLLLKEIQTDRLVLALKNASDDLKEKVFGNVSARAASMLREELELMGPVRVADVESAQAEIVDVALNLEKDNKITVAREGSADFV